MIDVYFSNVNKKPNSDIKPTSETLIKCAYKNPTSLYNPVLNVSRETFTFNYCRIGARYYFITDVVAINNGLFEVLCACDILATAIEDIQEQKAFMLYGISSFLLYGKYNSFDNRAVRNWTKDLVFDKNLLVDNLTLGNYVNIVNCVSENNTGTSIVTTYILTDEQLKALGKELNNPSFIDGVIQQWKEPMACISSCYKLGIGLEKYLGSSNLLEYTETSTLQIGTYNTSISCLKLKDGALEKNNSYFNEFEIDLVPQGFNSTILTDKLGMNPYCDYWEEHWALGGQCLKIYLTMAYVGMIELPLKAYLTEKKVKIRYRMDITTGLISGEICDINGIPITTISGNCGNSIPLSNIQKGYENLGAVIGTIGSITGAVATGGIGGALLGINALSSAQNILENKTMMNGSFATNIGKPLLNGNIGVTITIDGYDSPWNILGDTLATELPVKYIYKYCQTEKASFYSSNLTNEENEQLNMMFDNGVYINEDNVPYE